MRSLKAPDIEKKWPAYNKAGAGRKRAGREVYSIDMGRLSRALEWTEGSPMYRCRHCRAVYMETFTHHKLERPRCGGEDWIGNPELLPLDWAEAVGLCPPGCVGIGSERALTERALMGTQQESQNREGKPEGSGRVG